MSICRRLYHKRAVITLAERAECRAIAYGMFTPPVSFLAARPRIYARASEPPHPRSATATHELPTVLGVLNKLSTIVYNKYIRKEAGMARTVREVIQRTGHGKICV
jgi:hypothetical protein